MSDLRFLLLSTTGHALARKLILKKTNSNNHLLHKLELSNIKIQEALLMRISTQHCRLLIHFKLKNNTLRGVLAAKMSNQNFKAGLQENS